MLRAALLGSVDVASFAAFYAAMAPQVGKLPATASAPQQAVATPHPPPRVNGLRGAASDPEERVAVAFQVVRDVTPENITAAPRSTGALVRIAPPAGAGAAAAPPRDRSELFYNPVIASAGTIIAGGRKITLAGIAAPGFSERCGEAAEDWPCGRMARAALRRFVRGRALECEIPAGAEEVPEPAFCRVAGEDLAAWLVAQGWAKSADPAGPHAEAEEAARAAQLGLWATMRPGAQPADVAASAPESARPISERVSAIP
jgi:endonuclease YncB( thermonuclease family)